MLVASGATKQAGQLAPTLGLRIAAGLQTDGFQGGIDFDQAQRRLGGWLGQITNRGITDAYLALPQLARQVRDADWRFGWLESPQEGRDELDLCRTRGRRADRCGRLDDVFEQRHPPRGVKWIIGRRTVNVAPLPSSLATSIVPP